jgi:hypothetical protein
VTVLRVFTARANKFICRHDLPEPDEDDIATIISDERRHITSSLNACLAPLNAPDEPTDVIDMNKSDLSTLSFEKLVSLRSRHQTRQAASGVRKKTTSGRDQTHAKLPTERQLLLRRFQEIIKEQQEQGAGTGAERGLRWRMGNAPAAGNAANAAAAAKTRHKKVCQPPIFTDIVTRY